MLQLALVAALVALPDSGAPPPKYVGKKITLTEPGVLVSSMLQVIGDVSKLNIVLLDTPPTPRLDVKAEAEPWDQLLAEVIERAGLTTSREGNVVVVGTPKRMAGRKGGAKFTAKRVSLDLHDADVRDAVELLSRLQRLDLAATRGERRLTLRLHNVPGDQAAALLLELAGARSAPRVPPPPGPAFGCLAPKTPLEKLKVSVISSGVAQPLVVVVDEKAHPWFAGRMDQLGVGCAPVNQITQDFVITAGSHDLSLGYGALPHNRPKTEKVSVDALLAEMDKPGALVGTGLTGALARQRLALRCVRDVLGISEVEESLPRDDVARLSSSPAYLWVKVDAAIRGGAHAKPEVLRPFVTADVSVDGSKLFEAWARVEVGDVAAAQKALGELLDDLESMANFELEIEDKPVKGIHRAPPENGAFVLSTLARLKALGGPASELQVLENRTRTVLGHYVGEEPPPDQIPPEARPPTSP